ncbi:MAG: redoxin domain-containing protein, partial [Deltaproteobacteria bacterium]
FACSTKPIAGTNLTTGQFFSTSQASQTKGTVVVFLSAKCPCSQNHESSLKTLAKEFSEFTFVGVHSNTDEAETLASEHFKNAALPFPVIQDRDSKLANEFGALKTPHVFIVGPQGQCWFNGGVDDTKDASKAKEFYLKNALLDIKEGKEPKQKTARALGCTIKR